MSAVREERERTGGEEQSTEPLAISLVRQGLFFEPFGRFLFHLGGLSLVAALGLLVAQDERIGWWWVAYAVVFLVSGGHILSVLPVIAYSFVESLWVPAALLGVNLSLLWLSEWLCRRAVRRRMLAEQPLIGWFHLMGGGDGMSIDVFRFSPFSALSLFLALALHGKWAAAAAALFVVSLLWFVARLWQRLGSKEKAVHDVIRTLATSGSAIHSPATLFSAAISFGWPYLSPRRKLAQMGRLWSDAEALGLECDATPGPPPSGSDGDGLDLAPYAKVLTARVIGDLMGDEARVAYLRTTGWA